MTITGSTVQPAAAFAVPARLPGNAGGGSVGGQAEAPVEADAQAVADPLQPTAADGWSPAKITAVRSRHEGGFVGAALQFTLGGVDERPGQRLSVAQVDQLAPFFAAQFGLDEGYVRRELAKVYVYVGGPAIGNQAMTIGHHVFVPDEQSLERIMTRSGRGWLTHELAHTMQFLAYQGGSPHRFLADYLGALVIGRDPQQPGSGRGPAVWGAVFTGLRSVGHPEEAIGDGATSVRDHVASSVLPAAAIAIPVALTASGGLAAARATTGRRVLGTGSPLGTAMGVVAAPALAGAVVGSFQQQLGTGWTQALGTVAGGALAGAALWRGGAFGVGGRAGLTNVGHALGRGTAIGLAAAATLGGAAIGFLSATATANTVRGWSSSAHVLHSLHNRPAGEAPKELSFQDAVHDSHWLEIDAEAIARRFTREWKTSPSGSEPVTGRTPTGPSGFAERADASLSDRLDWGVKLPLLVGIPAAIGVGAGVLATRTGFTLLRSTVRDGLGPGAAIRRSLELLGSQHRGIGNSLGVGAALTVAPLMVGGIVGPLVHDVTGSDVAARLGGAGAGAVAAGALLPLLLRGNGASVALTSTKVAAGMAVAGALGLIAGGVATDALRPHGREYDTTSGSRASG